MMPTDTDLLTRYVDRRDEAAFEALVERYLPLVRGVLWRRMGDVGQVGASAQLSAVGW
jgi:DNA-directed RNA polymerase specialized sigma24 family protein